MKKVLLFLLLSFTSTFVLADTKWELKKDKDGIKVYTGSVANSNIKAVKVSCIMNTTLEQLVAILLDTKAHEKWVYNTEVSYLIKTITTSHQLYYSEINMPWPLANRDVIMDIQFSQDKATKVMYVSGNAVEGYVPVNKNKVRVRSSKISWTITPINKTQIDIAYTAQADPGGAIPAWIANMFMTKGPFETFKKLKEMVALNTYPQTHYDFIVD